MSQQLQRCDISVFAPLKSAYREQVERLERGCVGTIGKQHFTYLYSPARQAAFTRRNIRAAWAGAGLFPSNSERVLSQLPRPAAEPTHAASSDVVPKCHAPSKTTSPQTPVTPSSTEAVQSLHNLITQDTELLDEAHAKRLQKHVQKLTNATQLSFAERALLQENVRFLSEINNESKVRRATKSKVIGTARVMSFEDLVSARAERATKEATKKAASEARKARKAEKAFGAAARVQKVPTGKRGRGRTSESVPIADASAPSDNMILNTLVQIDDSATVPWQAPVAKMW